MSRPLSLRKPCCRGSICLLLTLAVGCGRDTASPHEETHPAQVKAQKVQRATLNQWTNLFGTSRPLVNHEAAISAAVEGRVLAILPQHDGQSVTEGQQIKAGQVIVQLDDRIARANRDKADKQREQAKIAVDLANVELRAAEELNMGTRSSNLPLAPAIQVEKARIAVRDAEAKEKAAAAELTAIDQQLIYYKLTAPISGRLGQIQVVPGQHLSPGTVVATVVSLDDIDVVCMASPDAAARLKIKQTARLTRYDSSLPESASAPPGQVVFLGVQAEVTGNVPVKVRFPNRELQMHANAVVTLQVLTQTEKNALAIPASALSMDQEPPTVLLVEPDKDKEGKPVLKARKLQAVIGIRDRDQGLVELRGLRDPDSGKEVRPQDDMQFIVEGGTGLESGDLVELPKEEHDKEEHDKEK
jgi:membrane fusion protein, multidrug efflux system